MTRSFENASTRLPTQFPHPTRAATLDCFAENFLYLSVTECVFRTRVYIYNQMENRSSFSTRIGKAGIRFLSWWLCWPVVNNDNPVPFDRIFVSQIGIFLSLSFSLWLTRYLCSDGKLKRETNADFVAFNRAIDDRGDYRVVYGLCVLSWNWGFCCRSCIDVCVVYECFLRNFGTYLRYIYGLFCRVKFGIDWEVRFEISFD